MNVIRDLKIDIDEALRYLGVKDNAQPALRSEMQRLADELQSMIQPRFTFRVFSLKHQERDVLLERSGIALSGEMSAEMLKNSKKAVLLLCTLGAGFDSMLRSMQARDMSKALMLDALGSAYVEAACDAAENELKKDFPESYLTDRFSPGYGDLLLENQKLIFSLINLPKTIGLTLNSSLLMTPFKSVTAFIGLSPEKTETEETGCAGCTMSPTCEFRKEDV